MNIDDIEHKIACGEMTPAQVFTQMNQHIPVPAPPARSTAGGEDGAGADLTRGVWFQAAVSGLWYRSHEAAGVVRVVLVEGRSFFKDGS